LVQETKKYFFSLLVITSLVIFFPTAGKAPGADEAVLGAQVVSRSFVLPVAADRADLGPEPKTAVPELRLGAAAALVKDVKSGLVLYDKDSGTRFPIASLTKLMTALVVERILPGDAVVIIDPSDLKVPEYRVDLIAGENIYASDLIKAMLVASANDAAYALARAASGSIELFAKEMNREAARLGMKNTSFTNPAGLDDPRHFSSAQDLSILVDEYMKHSDLLAISRTKQTVVTSLDDKFIHRLHTTNQLLLKDDSVIGLKTGYTTEARGNLIALVAEPLFYTILLGSDDREGETENLITWTKKNFIWK